MAGGHGNGQKIDEQPGTLLVVDDNEMNRDLLSRRLAKRGHDVLMAEDGYRALEMIEDHDFDLILLDIMMPGLDGYEVLAKIREQRGPGNLPVIMATAKDESQDIVRAFKLGANDFVTKPFDFPVVRARVATQVALKRSQQALAKALDRIQKNLDAAARIQQSFLPTADPGIAGVRFAWKYEPCDELAGDTLNIIPLDDRHVGVYVLDVSGHGVASSLLSVALSRLMTRLTASDSILWNEAEDRPSTPTEVVDELAQRFPYDIETGQYFTLAYGVLDVERRQLCYTSAGHVPIILARPGADPVQLDSTGPPVALVPSEIMPSEYTESVVDLAPGDRLYLYSDGIPEATNPDDEQFGEARLGELVTELLSEDLDNTLGMLVDRVRAWCGEAAFDDDVTVLAVEVSR
jgi:serine phosphatase RsbU (regulator of sigma subunit)